MFDPVLIAVRESIRSLRRSPGVSALVVGTLAAAIGANVTVFSLLNAAWLRTLAVAEPDRIVAITATDTRTNQPGYIYADTFEAFRAQQHSLSNVSMHSSSACRVDVRGTAQDVGCEGVMPAYFELLGVRTIAGRSLTDEDAGVGNGATGAVISDRLWRREFGGDARAIGKTIQVGGEPVTIVGVAAPGFAGLDLDAGSDLYLPIPFARRVAGDSSRPFRATTVVGRLGPGVTLQQARAEAVARWPGILAATSPTLPPAAQASARAHRLTVASLATGFSGTRSQYGEAFIVLIGLTSILLAVATVNLVGVMSARGSSRRHEIAVRLALGVSRTRLFQQFLIEGLLLALCGLVIAMLLAWWSTNALTAILSVARTLPLQRPLTPDAQVVTYAVAVAVAMGLGIALWPAWQAVRYPVDEAIRQGRTVARPLGRAGRLMLSAQVAISIVLLVGAGLFESMLSSLRANEAQFRGRNVVWTRLARNPGDRTALDESYFRNLVARLSTMPSAESVVLSTYFPAYLGFRGQLPESRFTSEAATDASPTTGMTEFITPGFFSTFGIPQLRGRDFTWDDDGRAPAVTILSDTLAKRLFGVEPAIGRRLVVSSGAARIELDIVGVVADAPIGSIREPHLAVAFRPMLQDLSRGQFPLAHVRLNRDVSAARGPYARLIASEGHHFVRTVFTLDEWLDNALLQERLIAGVARSSALLTVLLACVGTYGLLALAVSSRMREIGVRMSIGATRASVVGMIITYGLRITIIGTLVGIPCALGAATLIRSQLYGVTPADPGPILGATVLLLAAGILAAAGPALQASRIDPVETLRRE